MSDGATDWGRELQLVGLGLLTGGSILGLFSVVWDTQLVAGTLVGMAAIGLVRNVFYDRAFGTDVGVALVGSVALLESMTAVEIRTVAFTAIAIGGGLVWYLLVALQRGIRRRTGSPTDR